MARGEPKFLIGREPGNVMFDPDRPIFVIGHQ